MARNTCPFIVFQKPFKKHDLCISDDLGLALAAENMCLLQELARTLAHGRVIPFSLFYFVIISFVFRAYFLVSGYLFPGSCF